MTITIALDAMSGDHGYSVVVPAALHSLDKNSDLHLILVGDQQLLADEVSGIGLGRDGAAGPRRGGAAGEPHPECVHHRPGDLVL